MSSPESQPRTKQRALDVLVHRAAEVRTTLRDAVARDVLTDKLVEQIFEVAWRHQFDEDRSEVSRQIREIVNIALDARKE